MPKNKNAMTRYALLDRLLQDRRRNWSIREMTEYICDRLADLGEEPVTQRTVQLDLRYLEEESPFGVELERFRMDAPTSTGDGVYRKQCVRYADPSFSIFRKELSDDERSLLRTVLSTLGSFKGQANFEWLEDLAARLDVGEQPEIVSMSKNLSENSTLLAELYRAISAKAVITLYYHTFASAEVRSVELSPYLIKEYNNRWFLIASPFDSDRILTFALDRIDRVEYTSGRAYKSPSEDYMERYEDIVGVTFREGRPVERITFWVSSRSEGYVSTKPLHGSQRNLSAAEQARLGEEYPQLPAGRFFTIDCIENYELLRELSSFGPELIVVSPAHIADKIAATARSMVERYGAMKK